MRAIKELYDAGCVQRFHTLRTIQQHTIAHHSWGVALILLKITNPSAQLLAAAAYHDLAESITGDVPATAKWAYPELTSAIKLAEDEFDAHHGLIVDLTDEEAELLKWADMLELIMFARSEMDLGNKTMRDVFKRGIKYLYDRTAPSPEAEQLLKDLTYEREY